MQARNARVGLILFFIYLVLYSGFVLVNAFAPSWMDVVVFQGINLAIVSGFGLILVALILSAVYGFICRVPNGGASVDSTSGEFGNNGRGNG